MPGSGVLRSLTSSKIRADPAGWGPVEATIRRLARPVNVCVVYSSQSSWEGPMARPYHRVKLRPCRYCKTLILGEACPPCRKEYQRIRNRVRSKGADKRRSKGGLSRRRYTRKLRERYGLNRQAYDQLLLAQGGQCAICSKTEELVVDHCHSTGQVRGLLCYPCNIMLGMAKDSKSTLMEAINYLARGKV